MKYTYFDYLLTRFEHYYYKARAKHLEFLINSYKKDYEYAKWAVDFYKKWSDEMKEDLIYKNPPIPNPDL
jgi:hypothetical protein